MFADPELDELSIYMDDDFDDFNEEFDDDFDDDEDDVLDDFDNDDELYYDDVFKEEDIDEPYDDVEPEDGYNLRHRNDDEDDISFIDKYDL